MDTTKESNSCEIHREEMEKRMEMKNEQVMSVKKMFWKAYGDAGGEKNI